MNRGIERWQACDPVAMATEQSEAARIYAFEDAKHDILELHAEVERLRTWAQVVIEAWRAADLTAAEARV